MKQAFIAIAIGLGIIALSMGAGIHALKSTRISGRDVIVLSNTFVAVEATATNYLALPLCRTMTHVCRTRAISADVVHGVRAARVAVLALEADARGSPRHDASVTLYQAAEAAIASAKVSLTPVKAPHGIDRSRS